LIWAAMAPLSTNAEIACAGRIPAAAFVCSRLRAAVMHNRLADGPLDAKRGLAIIHPIVVVI
jgi:hypothetical protein